LNPSDVRKLLADGDIDAIQRFVVLQFTLLRRLVLLRLGDDGIYCDGRFTRRTVADDELTLTTTHGDHRINGHDAGLHGHTH
jgi:hypothetical protein